MNANISSVILKDSFVNVYTIFNANAWNKKYPFVTYWKKNNDKT